MAYEKWCQTPMWVAGISRVHSEDVESVALTGRYVECERCGKDYFDHLHSIDPDDDAPDIDAGPLWYRPPGRGVVFRWYGGAYIDMYDSTPQGGFTVSDVNIGVWDYSAGRPEIPRTRAGLHQAVTKWLMAQ